MISALEKMIAHEPFGVRLVAAGDKVTSRPACRGVHITELPDPTPWLEGGELIITTGISVAGSPVKCRKFVERIADRGCVALAYSPFDNGEPPKAMVRAAERVGLPMFTLPYELPHLDVTLFVTKLILDSQYAALRTAIALHRRVLSAMTRDAGVAAILNAAGLELPGRGFALVDFYGGILARFDPQSHLNALNDEQLRALCQQASRAGSRHDSVQGDHTWSAWSVRVCDEVEGFLVVSQAGEDDERAQLLLEQVLAGVTLTLGRQLSMREARRALVSELIETLANSHASRQVVAERMRKVLPDLDRPIRMLCIPISLNVKPVAVCRLVEDKLARWSPAVGHYEHAIYAIVAAEHSEAASELVNALHSRGWPACVGRSRVHAGVDGAMETFGECSAAAQGAPPRDGVYDIEDVDVVALLVGSRAAVGELGTIVVDRILGPLIEYEEQERAQLLTTVATFLKHGCKPGPAAEDLSIHRHTLSYRLDKVASLTGRDPRNGDHLLEYTLALELHRRTAAEREHGWHGRQQAGPSAQR